MSNPTDTNQASEIAEQIIQDFRKWHDGQWDYNGDDPRQKGTKTIQSLIRTEKLKLLAEVRERVVGEDEPVFYGDGQIGNTPQEDRNELRSEQKFNLAKLEAEL